MAMGRPRGFDDEQAIADSMACFREHGYGGTSVRALEAASGLKAASIYNAFGNKAALFEHVLRHYRRTVLERRVATHLQPQLGLDGIRSFFTSTYLVEPHPQRGCLFVNSATEFDQLDAAAQSAIEDGLTQLHAAFFAQLLSCVESKEVADDVDVDRAAQTLVVAYQGMLLIARTRQSVVEPGGVCDALLNALRHPSTN